MNKQDLVEALSTRLHKSQRDAAETIDALVEEIKKAIAKGESIRISGFGAFEQTVRNARQGRNPRTGEPVRIAPTRVVRFRPAADFKAIVAGTRRAVADAMPGGAPQQSDEAPAPVVPPQQSAPSAEAVVDVREASLEQAPAAGAPEPSAAGTAQDAPAPKMPRARKAPTKSATTSTASKSSAAKTAASKAAASKTTAAKTAAKRAPAKKTAASARKATASKTTAAPAAKRTTAKKTSSKPGAES